MHVPRGLLCRAVAKYLLPLSRWCYCIELDSVDPSIPFSSLILWIEPLLFASMAELLSSLTLKITWSSRLYDVRIPHWVICYVVKLSSWLAWDLWFFSLLPAVPELLHWGTPPGFSSYQWKLLTAQSNCCHTKRAKNIIWNKNSPNVDIKCSAASIKCTPFERKSANENLEYGKGTHQDENATFVVSRTVPSSEHANINWKQFTRSKVPEVFTQTLTLS